MRLVWREEGGEESLLNLVIRRSTDIPNLVYLRSEAEHNKSILMRRQIVKNFPKQIFDQ